jgi:hypothetical protein
VKAKIRAETFFFTKRTSDRRTVARRASSAFSSSGNADRLEWCEHSKLCRSTDVQLLPLPYLEDENMEMWTERWMGIGTDVVVLFFRAEKRLD